MFLFYVPAYQGGDLPPKEGKSL